MRSKRRLAERPALTDERLGRPPDRAIGLSRRRLPDVPGDHVPADPVGGDHAGRGRRRGPRASSVSLASSPRAPPGRCSATSSGISPPARSAIDRLRPIVRRHGKWLTISWTDVERAQRWFDAHGIVFVLPRADHADGAVAGLDPGGPARHAVPQFRHRLDDRHRDLDHLARRAGFKLQENFATSTRSCGRFEHRAGSWSLTTCGGWRHTRRIVMDPFRRDSGNSGNSPNFIRNGYLALASLRRFSRESRRPGTPLPRAATTSGPCQARGWAWR